jgi:hypothetical protein
MTYIKYLQQLKLDFKFRPHEILTVQHTVTMKLLVQLFAGGCYMFSKIFWGWQPHVNHCFINHPRLHHPGCDTTEHATLTNCRPIPAQGRSGYIIWKCWELILIHIITMMMETESVSETHEPPWRGCWPEILLNLFTAKAPIHTTLCAVDTNIWPTQQSQTKSLLTFQVTITNKPRITVIQTLKYYANSYYTL